MAALFWIALIIVFALFLIGFIAGVYVADKILQDGLWKKLF